MPERIALIAAIALIVAVSVLAVRTWNARSARRGPAWDSLGEQPDGRRTLIAFSSPSCAACHNAQAPAIELAAQKLGETAVRVIRVDVAQSPEVARAFGILTVPSTVVVGAAGNDIVAINQGFAPSGRLLEQLQRA